MRVNRCVIAVLLCLPGLAGAQAKGADEKQVIAKLEDDWITAGVDAEFIRAVQIKFAAYRATVILSAAKSSQQAGSTSWAY